MCVFSERAGRVLARAVRAASSGAGQAGVVEREMSARVAVRVSQESELQESESQEPPEPPRRQVERPRYPRPPTPPRPPTESSWRRAPITRPSRKVTPNVMNQFFYLPHTHITQYISAQNTNPVTFTPLGCLSLISPILKIVKKPAQSTSGGGKCYDFCFQSQKKDDKLKSNVIYKRSSTRHCFSIQMYMFLFISTYHFSVDFKQCLNCNSVKLLH